MKNLSTFISIILLGGLINCGEDFLDKEPLGVVSDFQLANRQGLDELLIAAYAQLDGLGNGTFTNWPSTGASNFVWGSVPSDNSYSGSDANDNTRNIMAELEKFTVTPTLPYLDLEWRALYDGVSRCNDVIRVASKALEAGAITSEEQQRYIAEARFLRGHYHFDLKQEFANIPYVDEQINDFYNAGNVDDHGNYLDAWPFIESDFMHAIANLPLNHDQPGRADQWVAKAYLAKCYMWQMELQAAKPLLDDILQNGPYELVDNYHDNFRISTNNNKESIWEYQASVNDGAVWGVNGNFADVLNFPQGTLPMPGGCCGFHQPSVNGVNAHQTDAEGLPLLDTFNETDVKNDQGIEWNEPFEEHIGPLDPRLDWSVGRRGIPYLDWGEHQGKAWIRDQELHGPYSPKKNAYYQFEEGVGTDAGSWAGGVTANNVRIIRLAHVILWRAEVAAAENDLEKARELVNRIRIRADNYHVQEGGEEDDTTHPNDAANYNIKPYPGFPSQEYAWKAIKFEHRLEFFMEGFRFFNLVRWGDAAKVLNKYLDEEQTKRFYLVGADFTPGKNEYFPIPQEQVDIVGPEVLKQNPGYQ